MSKRTSSRPARQRHRLMPAILEALERRQLLSGTTYTVTTTADSSSGPLITGSLRWAISQANSNPGPDTIAFQIPGSGVQMISPTSPLPAITDPLTIDGGTQPGFLSVPLIQLDGSKAGLSANGLYISAGSSTVKGLIVSNFQLSGIALASNGGNVIRNNFIGTDPSGTIAQGNGSNGLSISGGSSGNQIINNLISGNGQFNLLPGVEVAGIGTNANVLAGNLIGTDLTGTKPVPNGAQGVYIHGGAQLNRIGTNGDGVNDAAESNVISANGNGSNFPGVLLDGLGTNSNIVAGNFIGTDYTGTKPLGNDGDGVVISGGAQFNRVGVSGADAGFAAERNVIADNATLFHFPGVEIYGAGTNNNVVAGNYVGTDVTGAKALGNGGEGILVRAGAQFNLIGTNGDGVHDAAEGNLISGNGAGQDYAGVQLDGTGTNQNTVAGNLIGTDATGALALGNMGQGVLISSGAQLNRIGVKATDPSPAAERNVIAANGIADQFPGIEIYQSGSNQNVVAGNYIGTDITGMLPLGNGAAGVYIHAGAQNNLIGTDGDGVGDTLERNIIGADLAQGVAILEAGTNGNVVAGNYVGANASGNPLGNALEGIWIGQGAKNNRVGTNGAGADPAGEANLIVGNGATGVLVTDVSTANAIRGNSIHNNGTSRAGYLGIDLGNDGLNLNHGSTLVSGPNNRQNHPVLLSAAPGASTQVAGTLTSLPGTSYTIDLYASTSADGPFAGAGDRWLGSITATTNASGIATFSGSVGTTAAGEWITATATDSGGNTSEFSSPIQLPTVQQSVNAGAWTAIGPSPIMETQVNPPAVSGRVSVAAVDPTNPNVVYIAADGGGIWKTIDWLDPIPQWTPLTDNQPSLLFGNLSYSALAVAPGNSQVIYAAVSGPGGGILKSTDGGADWIESGNGIFNYASFASLVVSPLDANTLYVSVWSGATGGGGVYKSTDGGQTWTNTTAAFHAGAAADLVIDSNNPSTLYTGLVGDTTNAGAANGIYETTDGGGHWSLLTGGVISGNGVGATIRLAISPASSQTLYATVFDPALGNAPTGSPHRYKTTNGGTTWSSLAQPTNGQGGADIDNRISHVVLAVNPHNPNILYTNGSGSLYQSTDGGTTWKKLYSEDPVNVEFDDPGALIVTGDRGIYRWAGGQAAFESKQGNLANAEFFTLTLSPNDPATVYGVAQDQSNSLKYGGSTVWNYTGGGDEFGRIVVDPTNPSRIYEYDPLNATSFVYRSDDGGATFIAVATNSGTLSSGIPTNPAGFSLARTTYKAFVMDPSNHDRLLVGTDRVYQTLNDGTSWAAISPQLSAGQFISALAIAPSSGNTVYAATGDGKLFVTMDGSTWTELDAGLPVDPGNHVMDLQVDPANPQHAFAVTGAFLGGASGSNHAFVTTNGGQTWQNITGNLPVDDAGQAIAVDWRFAMPRLYVGTLHGVFLSSDGGGHWTPYGANLPNALVTDLQLSTNFNILAAATYGRGAFEIRVLTPLALLGDANLDGTVNFTDLLILARNYGKTGTTWANGDFNGDGTVNFADLLILAHHYGQTAATATAASLTPQVQGAIQSADSQRIIHGRHRLHHLKPAHQHAQHKATAFGARLRDRRGGGGRDVR